MKRWTACLAIIFSLFLFHSSVLAKAIANAETLKPSSNTSSDLKIVSGLDPAWNTSPSPFVKQSERIALKVGNGQITFPAILDSQNPITIQIQDKKVQQVLASGGTYQAELIGKYLVYRGEKNSILYRYDADKQSLREFVYLKDASVLAMSGNVIQWRFNGADLKLRDDGSVALTQTINIKNEVRKVSSNHMAERISRFLAKRRGTPEKPGSQTRILFTIPKPVYVDSLGKTLTNGIQYKVADAKLTLYLDPALKHTYPLWADPSLTFRADANASVLLNGQSTGDVFSRSVASAGDFNGDGIDDVVVGADFDDNNGNSSSGSAFIFFGQNPSGQAVLRADVDANIILDGQSAHDYFGWSVSSAGDFNGDGFDDVIIGAYSDDNNEEINSGSAFIFFGRNLATQLRLRADTDADIILDGKAAGDNFGKSVASAGDFNGDGFEDVIVGAWGDDAVGPASNSGAAYIFFGRNSTNQLTLRADSNGDVILNGQDADDLFGVSVASAGDFNGDGFDDVIVGAHNDDNNGEKDSGSAFIFFGRTTASQLILSADTGSDIILDGQDGGGCCGLKGDEFGYSVASAGDFNGDGLSDVIVGALWDDNNGEKDSGSAFIFFGQNPVAQLILRADSDANVILDGQTGDCCGSFGDIFGISVSSAGDFNGDGFDDVIVGAHNDDNNGQNNSGSAFIFFGRNSTNQLVLRAGIDSDITLDGQSAGDRFGLSVSTAGDFNGDGFGDVIVGANFDDNNGLNGSGSAFVFAGINTDFPIITLFGDNPATVQAGSTSFSFGATAQDYIDGDLTTDIVEGPLDTSVLGSQTVTYDVVNSRGFADHAERIVDVVDTTPPVITLLGSNPVVVESGNAYSDMGATALDNFDGNVTANIIVGGLPIDTSVLGTFIVTYDVADSLGNTAHAERTVEVVEIAPPLITILGNNPATVEGGTAYIDAGATAQDIVDGDLTANIVVGGLPLDTSTLGSKLVTYDVVSSRGGTAHAQRIVNVVDTQPPVVTAPADVGPVEATSIFTPVSIGTATATDNIGVIFISSDAPSSFPLGLTVVTWTATDASGNTGTATQNITIQDTTPPQFIAPSNITVFTMETEIAVNIGRVTAWDNSGEVFITNNAPALFPLGTTVVTWTITDSSGNAGTATQNVTVIQDTTPPVVTAPADVTALQTGTTTPVTIGTATATDNIAVASITSDAPTGFPIGTTVVTWTATDSAGNVDTATQNVTVTPDTTPPVITAPADITAEATEVNTPFDIGTATATDDGQIVSIVNDAPAAFPIGTTIVTWTATDGGGNIDTATQSITLINVNGISEIIKHGQSSSDRFGISVASAGDFNGDGFEDIIVGAYTNSNIGGTNAGSAYIFFGKPTPNPISPARADLDADIILTGQSTNDFFGYSVALAGDVNGDGLDDVIVGAYNDDNNGATNSGSAFIFFGRNPTNQLVLRADADADIILNGQSADDEFGLPVASAGDFNGDGLSDVIVGAHRDDNNGLTSGRAFIFFGRNSTNQLVLRADADADIILNGQNTSDVFGFSVGSAGDFNGDGLSDVIVGAMFDDNNGEINSGSAFIFFGRNPANQLSLMVDADANVILDGQSTGDHFGASVSSAGDFNGDGLDDVIVGAVFDDNNGETNSGSAFIFFGRNPVSQLNLRADADADIILNGQSAADELGISVASASDFNRDGFDDVIVGAYRDDNNGAIDSGSALILFGRNPASQIVLRADENADILFNGRNNGDWFGRSVSSAGDFNSDGFDDIVVGAYREDGFGATDSGSATIHLGENPPIPAKDVVMNFPGSGVSVNLNNNDSTVALHGDTAQTLITADVDNNGIDDVIVSFPSGTGPDGSGGTYISRNEGALTLLDSRTAEQIAAGDFDGNSQVDLLLGFGTDGLWARMNDTPATLLIDLPTVAVAAGDIDNNGMDDMVFSLTGVGTLSLINFTDVVFYDGSVAQTLAVVDIDNNGEEDVIASFSSGGPGGAGGTHIARNQNPLTLLDSRTANQITAGDFDGSGQQDLLLGFGTDGLWMRMNDTSASLLIGLPPVATAAGDIDDNGLDDMVLSFDAIGTFNLINFTDLIILDTNAATTLAVGNIDGN